MFNKEELALLHIMCCEALTRRTCRILTKKVELFPRANLPHLNLILHEFIKQVAKDKPVSGAWKVSNKDKFAADVLETLEGSNIVNELKERGKEILQGFIDETGEKSYEDGLELLRNMVVKFSERQLTSAIINGTAFAALKGLVNRGEEVIEEVSKSDNPDDKPLEAFDLVAAVPSLMRKRTLIPFGLTYLDQATRGGVCTKEMALIGAGTGQGKTMLAVDVSCAQARQNHLTMWFTYEQSFENDISERIMANFTGIGLSELRNKPFNELSESEQKLYWAATQGIDNLIGVDFSNNRMLDPNDPRDNGGVYSIEKQITAVEERTKHKVKFVIIDWFGEVIAKLAAAANVDLQDGYRFFARDFLRELREMMDRKDVFIMIFHQLSQKACDARPTYIPNKTDFQDMKTIANNMEWCFVMGKLDEGDIRWFRTDKARRCQPSTMTIKMDGEHARMLKVEDYYPGSDGNFHTKDEFSVRKTQDEPPDARTLDILSAYSE